MRIIIAGGGTGGHLMPGIALAQKITQEDLESRVLFLASDREADIRTLSRYGIEAMHLAARPAGRNPAAWPALIIGGLKLIRQCHRIIGDFAPDAAVGLGGYASFFPMVAACLQRVPLVLLEQNVIPGKATRRLAPFAAEVACQWQETVRHFGVKVRTQAAGNPIREEILAGGHEEAIEQLHLAPGVKTLLVAGGSQGAHAINRMMIACAADLAARAPGLQIVHLTGHRDRETVADAYEQAGLRAEAVAFLDDMSLAYRAADFALSRAGGTTIAELAACGIPSILVPYPHAANAHQAHNARCLAEAGAAVVLQQDDFTPERLVGIICKFLTDEKLRTRMRTACFALGRPNAADTIYEMLGNYAQTQTSNNAAQAMSPQPAAKENT